MSCTNAALDRVECLWKEATAGFASTHSQCRAPCTSQDVSSIPLTRAVRATDFRPPPNTALEGPGVGNNAVDNIPFQKILAVIFKPDSMLHGPLPTR